MILPTVLACRDGDHPTPPSTFVAAKSSRDAAQRLPAQAVTSVALRTCAPIWNQMLSVSYYTESLVEESLLLALMDDDASAPLCRTWIPLANLLPGKPPLGAELRVSPECPRSGEEEIGSPPAKLTYAVSSWHGSPWHTAVPSSCRCV